MCVDVCVCVACLHMTDLQYWLQSLDHACFPFRWAALLATDIKGEVDELDPNKSPASTHSHTGTLRDTPGPRTIACYCVRGIAGSCSNSLLNRLQRGQHQRWCHERYSQHPHHQYRFGFFELVVGVVAGRTWSCCSEPTWDRGGVESLLLW